MPDIPNPLEAFSTDFLVAELMERGAIIKVVEQCFIPGAVIRKSGQSAEQALAMVKGQAVHAVVRKLVNKSLIVTTTEHPGEDYAPSDRCVTSSILCIDPYRGV